MRYPDSVTLGSLKIGDWFHYENFLGVVIGSKAPDQVRTLIYNGKGHLAGSAQLILWQEVMIKPLGPDLGLALDKVA